MRMRVLLLVTFCLASLLGSFAEQCGRQANDALCPNGLCCSSFGFCGTTPPYCGGGCQSQCNVGDVMSSVITSSVFDKLLLHRNDAVCPMRGFYTYEAFIAATRDYPSFGKTGDKDTRKREVAAFLAHTSHETNGGWEGAPDGPFAWGYCYMLVQANCQPSQQVPRRAAYFKQKPEAEAIAIFKNALCIWMTPEDSKPSGHEIMSGIWKPTEEDEVAGRFPGFGATTNVLNGRVECGHGNDTRGEQRIGFYKRFCKILGVHPGDHLDCYNQVPFDKLSMQATSKISLLLANSMM